MATKSVCGAHAFAGVKQEKMWRGEEKESSGGPMTGHLAEGSFLTPRNMKVQEL